MALLCSPRPPAPPLLLRLQAFLGLAFLVEGTLLGFHLKGPSIEVHVHLILVMQILATVLAVGAEMAAPGNIVVASARPWLTMLQGVWWIQTAYIMYTGNPAWDPDYMGAAMMAPVVFAVHMLWIAAAMLARESGGRGGGGGDGEAS